MTPTRFQQWLEGLRIPECYVDFKYNRKENSFDVHVISDVNGVSMLLPTRYHVDKLNDTRLTQKTMDEFIPKTIAALEKAGKKFNFKEQ